jgi:outer membrane protein assembly factor BamB
VTLNRRDFVKAGLAVALTPRMALARPPRSFSFVYFSDTHLALGGRNERECREMIQEILHDLKPDFAVNGGDVTDYGWRGEYDGYRRVLAGVPFPVHHVPGNHDVRWSPLGPKIFRQYCGEPFRAMTHKGCRFVMLDSSVPLSHWGHFESQQLRWLAAELRASGREVPVFLFTHHWVGRDRVMVDNEHELLRIIEPYNVKLILNGHGHQDLLWSWDGIAGTMNKGLYQGSYQQVEVDWTAGEVRLTRRTMHDPMLRPVTTVPLAPRRASRPLWAIPATLVRVGDAVRADAPGATEYRWDDGKWAALAAASVPTAGLTPGAHLLSLRAGEGGAQRAFPVPVAATGGALKPRWERRLTGGVMSHLRLAGGVLYASAMDGSLTALRAEDGAPLWTARTRGYCHSSPWVGDGRAIVGSADGAVYAFDLRNGRQLWRRATGGPVYASAAVARGVAAIASGDGKVYGLDTRTGSVRWSFALPPGDTAFAQSPAATDGDRFYVGAWDRNLYALDVATGREIWRRQCTEKSFAYSPAIGGPAVGGGRVFVPSNDNVLHALDAATGAPLWRYTAPGDKVGYSSPTLDGERIYIGCLGEKGQVRCVSATDGRELWTAETRGEIYDSSPALAGGRVAIGSVNGTLSVLSAATGEIVAQHRFPPGHFLSSPAAGMGSVYAATFSDVVIGFDLA